MHIAELSQISGYTENQTRTILSTAGYQLKGQEVFGLANLDGKDVTADEYLRAAKKAGVDADQLPPAPQSNTAALAPADKGTVAKGKGRSIKKSQIEKAGENVQSSTANLQKQAVEAGVKTGIDLGNLFAGGQQMAFLGTVASHNDQFAAVLGGQISVVNQEAEDAIDIEAIYESAAMGKSAAPTVGLQLFGS